LLDAGHIVGRAIDAVLVGADVDADDPARIRAREKPPRHGCDAFAVEPEAVDHGAVGGQAKQARARIARLRQRRHAADLDEAEAESQKLVGHLGMLVKAGRDPDRIGEREAEGVYGELLVVGRGTRQRRTPERGERQRVRGLGIERAQERREEPIEQRDHGASSGKTWRPSAPSGSGLTETTADIGSTP